VCDECSQQLHSVASCHTMRLAVVDIVRTGLKHANVRIHATRLWATHHASSIGWEGDWRLWEALASGALVLIDSSLGPPFASSHPTPKHHGQHSGGSHDEQLQQRFQTLQPDVHVVVYDSQDQAAFVQLMDKWTNGGGGAGLNASTSLPTTDNMAHWAKVSKLACSGYCHAMQQHQCTARIDRLLDISLKLKEVPGL
jgi:hypothetical protein